MPGVSPERVARFRDALAHAAHVLPAQGPIGVFIHHNTLHAFQHLHFHEAIATASALYGAQPYWPEDRYRAEHAAGRINDADLDHALRGRDEEKRASSRLPPIVDPGRMHRLALRHALEPETAAGLAFRVLELDATKRFRRGAANRRELIERSQRFVAKLLSEVGIGKTLCDVADALLGRRSDALMVDLALHGAPTASTKELLRRLAIPPAAQVGYLGLIDARTGRTGDEGIRARWLEEEWTHAALPLAQAFFGAIGHGGLSRLLERDPEAVAVAALYAICGDVSPSGRSEVRELASRVGRDRTVSDLIAYLVGEDPNDLVNPLMIRLSSAFLDRGLAPVPMPGREAGFFAAVRELVLCGSGPSAIFADGAAHQLRNADSPEELALDALDDLGVIDPNFEPYLERVLLQLPGWAGMFHWLEKNAEKDERRRVSLLDYVAVRLMYSVKAIREVAAQRLDYTGPLVELAPRARDSAMPAAKNETDEPHRRPWVLFNFCQLAGLGVADIAPLSRGDRTAIAEELEAFDRVTRLRAWHEAYEAHYRGEIAAAITANLRRGPHARPTAPQLQVLSCFDERAEGFRRHFEELSPDHETFGLAGFFGFAMRFRGLDDRGASPRCPIDVKPTATVEERPLDEATAARRAKLRALIAWWLGAYRAGTRSLVRGAVALPLSGIAALFGLAARVLFPRATGATQAQLAALLPSPATRLDVIGEGAFSLDEAAQRVRAQLENAGLVERFAPLVAVIGHGSDSVNNPHESAYDCGACGGRHGGHNARAFADAANDPEVRARLHEHGIAVPDATWFVAGELNTATDDTVLFDLDRVPSAHASAIADLQRALRDTGERHAHERCRRFASAPKKATFRRAKRHVVARSRDLAQVRPELGHVTIASAFVGRREITRGLFLDRRTFLISYDPTLDDDGAILERILVAAGPVGAGINLEYFFSCVDNDRYGAGTKLPHNPAALVGVMEGAIGDLRTGLPKQMIEIHEPIRLQIFVEAPPERLLAICERQPVVRELIVNEWVRIVSVDSARNTMEWFSEGAFRPLEVRQSDLPVVASSRAWYDGRTEFVPPAIIEARARSPHAA